MNTFVAPSLLAANPKSIPQEVALACSCCPYLHIDIMDGKFVPAKTWDPPFVKEISAYCTPSLVKDVHLMVEDPLSHIPSFIEAGADLVTFHYEACADGKMVKDAISLIHSFNKKAGVSIKPMTSPSVLIPYLKDLDLVLVMSVEPGKGGQKFMPSSLDKLSELSKIREDGHYSYLLEVDGGINKETGKLCVERGADVLVAGSYLFGHDDFKERVKGLEEL